MSDIGPVEQWLTNSAERREGAYLLSWVVPWGTAVQYAKNHDAEDAALRAALRQAGQALREQLDFRHEAHGEHWHRTSLQQQECTTERRDRARAALAAIEALEVKPK